MKTRQAKSLKRVLLAVALFSGAVGPVIAQIPPAAGERISGAQLQAWLDAKFSYAGVHKASQCVVLNVAQGAGRALFIRCPNGWAEKLSGSARVNGDTYCTSFPVPNTPPGEDCVSWHSLGDWKFEQRKGNELDTTVLILPQGLAAQK